MRRFVMTSLLLLIFGCSTVQAQSNAEWKINGVTLTPELVNAYHELAVARQRLIYYRQVSLPQQQRVLEDASRLSAAQILVLRRRLVDYEPFLAVGDYSAIRSEAEFDRLSLLAAQQNLRQLREQELAEMQFRGEKDNLYVYDVLRAAIQVRAAYAAGQK